MFLQVLMSLSCEVAHFSQMIEFMCNKVYIVKIVNMHVLVHKIVMRCGKNKWRALCELKLTWVEQVLQVLLQTIQVLQICAKPSISPKSN
jgi:hypothetical protein